MKKWVRRIRGAIGMGVAWGLTWLAAGLLLLLVIGPDAADVPFPLGFGLLGFLAGVTFSAVIGIMEGRRRFDQMSLGRFAVWGGVGGVLFSGIFVLAAGLAGSVFLVVGPVFALAGAGSAAGALALARRAEDQTGFDADAELAQIGLTEEEKRRLLGGG